MKFCTCQAQTRGHLARIGQIPVHAVMVKGAQAVAARGSVRDEAGLRAGNRQLVPQLVHLQAGLFDRSALMNNHFHLIMR